MKTRSRTTRATALAVGIAVAAAVLSAAVPASATDGQQTDQLLGQEPYRPQLHFSPDQNWMNDPNGLLYYKGVYNMFFQHNPSGNEWGNMSWGHATSTDLMHWTMQPLAIPQGPHEYIFSGSAVVDYDNTTGFGTAGNPAMVAIYTSQYHDDPVYGNREAQSLAYSLDDGMTWTKYSGNPVLDRNRGDFRDPKVFWYGSKATGYWVMAAVEADNSTVILSKSSDLKSWTYLSSFTSTSVPSFWECPDLFPLPLDGDTNNTKWIMEMSAGGSHQSYIVGDFDGTTFTEDKAAAPPLPAGDVLQSFDGGNYANWTIDNDPTSPNGGPFGTAPATGAIGGQQPVSGFSGTGLVNSFLDGDGPIGIATSPQFTIDSSYINFLVGGGNHPRAAGTGTGAAPAGDTLFDFEPQPGKTLADQGWTGTGDLSPADQPAGPHSQPNVAQGFQGMGYLSTFYTPNGNDNATGTLTSPQFTINKKYLDLLVGGGQRDAATGQTLAVQLVVDGAVVKSETGTNEHMMNWRSWDLSDYQGKTAQLRVVDTATGGWAAIWIDDVVASDVAAIPRSTETTVNLVVDGQTVRSATGPSDDGTISSAAEFLNWMSWNVKELRGKSAQIQIVDNNTGGFGHILADQFMTSNQAAKPNPLPVQNQLDWGRDNYASNTFIGVPGGKRISIGWMGQAFTSPTTPWRGNATLPRELTLKTVDGRPQIVTKMVDQLADYQDSSHVYTAKPGTISEGTQALPDAASGELQRINVELKQGDAQKFGIVVRGSATEGTRIGYDMATRTVYIDRSKSGLIPSDQFATPNSAPVQLEHGRLQLEIVVDRGSVEVLINGGEKIMTNLIYPSDQSTTVSLFAEGGTAKLRAMTVAGMHSAMWAPNPSSAATK
jgi:levanase